MSRSLFSKADQAASWNPKLFAKRQLKKGEPLERQFTRKKKFNFLKIKFQSGKVINSSTLENSENCLEF